MKELAHRVAVVTGASSGIGRAIAEAYAAAGAKVVLAARRADELKKVAAGIKKKGGTALAVETDITDEHDVANLFAAAKKAFGRVDILVNNAGTNAPSPPEDLSLADWRRVIDVNLTGAFLCAREAFRLMKKQKGGRIINIGSVSAKVSRVNSTAYTTSKWGLDGMTRSLQLDGRPHGIAVSALHPGNTETPIWAERVAAAKKEGIMPVQEVARVAVLMAALPPKISMLESIVMPITMPFIGRG